MVDYLTQSSIITRSGIVITIVRSLPATLNTSYNMAFMASRPLKGLQTSSKVRTAVGRPGLDSVSPEYTKRARSRAPG